MNAPTWWSQPFAPEGSAASEGIKKQLGVPRMDPLAVLVRESAQNSWDARQPHKSVSFGIEITRPGRAMLDRWADLLLPEPSHHGAFGLAEVLSDDDATMLTISDRGTTGLGGPLRADTAAIETPDFVNLVRNIGEPRDKTYGGGTYGFGKGVLFTASVVGSVLIRTRCLWQGRPQTRLIGVALGHSFAEDGRRHTGRHWWGRIVDDIPDPLLDGDADDVAGQLGLPSMAEGEFGTDIVVIGARLGATADDADLEDQRPRTVQEAGEYVASAMLWHLWPLLLPRDGRFALRCYVRADGRQIHVPDPRQVVRLKPFVDAYVDLSEGRSQAVRRQRPATQLGLFAARAHMAPTRRAPEDVAAPFDGNGQHCVLLREPRLVVRYVPGPPLPDEMLHYGAVFLADRELDAIFAAAEPPTHDDWVHDSLPNRDNALLVRYTLRRVIELIQEFTGSAGPADLSGGTQPPLGALSGRLGVLLPTATGTGADGSGGPGRTGSGPSERRPVRIVDGPRLVRAGDEARILTTLEVDPVPHRIAVRVRPLVALDQGSESDPPAGADAPEVIELRSEDGSVARPGDLLTVEPDEPRRWLAVIRPVVDAATRVRLEIEEGGVR
ncbi:hypothetical protein [Actinophytocola sp.]|uniref:hypothetical protein n=1 Tax=Actinophytocola sp. TaxID=1872138 RepID=UPI00389A2C3D